MDESFNPYDPQSPAEPPKRPAGRLSRVALTGGIAVGLALGGAGLAYAASSSTSTSTPGASSSPSTTVPGKFKPDGPFKGGHAGFRGHGMPGVGPGVVHGTFTVRDGSGGYKTVQVQNGQVTSVSSSSITVKSSDGYTHTYRVLPATVVDSQAGGISSVASTDQVELVASSQNGSDTATNIIDATKIHNSRGAFGFLPHGKPPAAGSGSSSSAGFGGPGPFGGVPDQLQ